MKITWSNFVEKNGMRFYGALERQVRDQIRHHQKRYVGMDDQKHELNFD